MSDIVWAINPNKDHLSDLSQRMRHFASDVCHGPPDRLPLSARPTPNATSTVGANVRREVFLFFKEAVNNMVRHSGCTEADLELRAEPDGLVLRDQRQRPRIRRRPAAHGHGLSSMRERTRGLGRSVSTCSRSPARNGLT